MGSAWVVGCIYQMQLHIVHYQYLNTLKVLFETLFESLVPILAVPLAQKFRTQFVRHDAEIPQLIRISLEFGRVHIGPDLLYSLNTISSVKGIRECKDTLILERPV